jgi:hypothetical protein
VVKSPEDALEWAKAVVEVYNKGEVKWVNHYTMYMKNY